MILLGLIVGAALLFLRHPKGAAPVASQFDALYQHWGDRYDVPPELLHAIAIRESRENPHAIGRNFSLFPDDWDYGLMQINARVAPIIADRVGHRPFEKNHLMIANVSVQFAAWLINDNRRISGDGAIADMASAYNYGLRSGKVVKPYRNQGYVEGVITEWQRLT
jgi:soluble lytic murein transglycosylase-like protein